jgi:hypothetical protein
MRLANSSRRCRHDPSDRSQALDDYELELTFNTGEIRLFNARPYLDKGIFHELRDPAYFRTVRLAFGSIAWPHEQDFGPESLYVESLKV